MLLPLMVTAMELHLDVEPKLQAYHGYQQPRLPNH